jgi:hypothetical protein
MEAASERTTMSVPPPAPQGTMSVMGRSGQAASAAEDAMKMQAQTETVVSMVLPIFLKLDLIFIGPPSEFVCFCRFLVRFGFLLLGSTEIEA